MEKRIIKVVVLGPESTGKSFLCKQLADHYNTVWVPEYAREFLETNGMDYTYEDLLEIAKGQMKAEKSMEAHAKNNLLFIDTDMNVMRVWCDFVFGKCHDWILEQQSLNKYDLYLLCNTDLPWVKDNLREYPDIETRQKLFGIYKKMMVDEKLPWAEISGGYEERFKKAVNEVDKLIRMCLHKEMERRSS